MFKALKLKRRIKMCKQRIEELETKRLRSQGALVDAILAHKDPDDEDVDYFNKFTLQINAEREMLHILTEEYNRLRNR